VGKRPAALSTVRVDSRRSDWVHAHSVSVWEELHDEFRASLAEPRFFEPSVLVERLKEMRRRGRGVNFICGRAPYSARPQPVLACYGWPAFFPQESPAPTTNDKPGAMRSLEDPQFATLVNRAPADGEWSYGREHAALSPNG
jgi:hypothetical protein